MKRLLSGGLVLGLALLLTGCSAALISDTDNSDNDNTDPGLAAVDLAQVDYTRATITWTEPAGTTGYELRTCEAGDAAPTWNECPPAAEQPPVCGANQLCEYTVPNLGLKTYRAYLSYKVGSNRSESASVDIDARFKLARFPGDRNNQYLGSGLALGDLDRDGVKDLAAMGMGVPARVFVFKGGRDFLRSSAGVPVPMADISYQDMVFVGLQAGDLTCDGHDDLLINGYDTDMWVSSDAVTWERDMVAAEMNTDFFRIGGPDLAENPHMPAIADLVGNGCPDMVMGAPWAFNPDSLGELDLLPSGIAADINDFGEHYSDPAWRGSVIDQKLGYYTYNVGDVDGNGRDEILFSARYNVAGLPPPNVGLKFFAHDGGGYVITPADPDYFYLLDEERTIPMPGGAALGVFAGPLGDIDGDGVNDFWVTSLRGLGIPYNEVRIFLGQRGELSPRPEDFLLNSVNDHPPEVPDSETFGLGVAADDFDHDGNIELLVGSFERIYVYRYSEGTANYEFAETLSYPCTWIQVWDFNQDHYNDIICGNLPYGGAQRLGAQDFRY